MANNDESDILNGADEPEQDFEAYLSQKLKEFEWKPSEIPTTDLPAPGVAESSSSVPNQPKDESETSSSSGDAHDAVGFVSEERLREINGPIERAPKLTLHSHPIVGHYITESSEPVIVDEELQRVYFSTFEILTTDVTDPEVALQQVEKIIARQTEIYRAIAVMKMQDSGTRWAMSHLLELVNASDRSRIIQLDKKERAARERRVVAKPEKSTKAKAATVKAIKPKGEISADTWMKMGYDKVGVENKVREKGLLDESTQAYIDKLFA